MGEMAGMGADIQDLYAGTAHYLGSKEAPWMSQEFGDYYQQKYGHMKEGPKGAGDYWARGEYGIFGHGAQQWYGDPYGRGKTEARAWQKSTPKTRIRYLLSGEKRHSSVGFYPC